MTITALTAAPSSRQGLTLRRLPTLDPETLLANAGPEQNMAPRSARPPAQEPTAPSGRDERPKQLVARFGVVVLEVLQQRRGAHQLHRWLSDDAAVALAAWSRHALWQGARIGSARACLLNAAVVEGCVRVDHDGHSTMLTLRLERRRQRWLCTDFAILRGQSQLLGRVA
ncbi:Rv3235 family protein [Aestuariimicrobium ganziense]|uniref:Rv3235 family protein n=1 Tax=Aestuariimicrobium ganziense TaxID=2773677 RepID=UPI0019408A5F|nr:Rv3235 family protein [Aestuariimicrobium ganziense]